MYQFQISEHIAKCMQTRRNMFILSKIIYLCENNIHINKV